MAETKDERRARLQDELRALETEDREADISQRADQTSMGDVVSHLVAHSAGYPTLEDREVHARAVRKEFGLGEYAPDEVATAEEAGAGAEKAGAEKAGAEKARAEKARAEKARA